MKRKYSKIVFVYALLSMLLLNFGCRKEHPNEQEIRQIFKELKRNQARILLDVNGKAFYPVESFFSGRVSISDQMLSVVIEDQSGGKVMMNLGGEKWYLDELPSKKVSEPNAFDAGLKFGKLLNQKEMIGEGYMMMEGSIKSVLFEEGQMIFKIKGKVAKYSDFNQPETQLPVSGTIVYKMPAISWSNVTEKDVFGTRTLDR